MTRPHRNHYARFLALVSAFALLLTAKIAGAAPPVLTVPGSQSVSENQSLQFGVSAVDPEGQSVDLRATGVPSGASFTDNRNNTGTFAWTPVNGDAGSYSVAFTADDTFGGLDTEPVAITVLDGNTPPYLGPIADRTMDPETMAIFSFWAIDDDSDPLTFRQTGVPAWGQFADYGDGTASLILVPPAGSGGDYPITIHVSDGTDETSQTFLVTVTGASQEHPPVLQPIADLTLAEGATAVRDLSASDSDGDALTWSSTLPPFATFSVLTNAGGSSTARVSAAPGYCKAGDYASSATVSDGTASHQQSFVIHVTDTPRSPVWNEPAAGTVVELLVDTETTLPLAGADPDEECGGPAPVFAIASSDAGSALVLELLPGGGGDADLRVRAGAAPGEYHVVLRLKDGADASRYVDRSVTVKVQESGRVAEARAWTRPKEIHLWLGSSWQRFYLEPGAETFAPADVDPSSIRVSAWEGAGSGGSAMILPGTCVVGTDNDENGVLELRFDVAKSDLGLLFQNLVEPAEGLVTVTATLHGGGPVSATFATRVHPDKKRAIKRCGPNPLNPEAVVEVETDTEGRLRVMVFDVSGRMVRVLHDEANAPAGSREIRFDGHDGRGRQLRAGRYFVRVESTRGLDSTPLTILP
ncbi:MAG TPA: putative Ig domain-containing protein [Acidobacteriota bacterium]|nr:putative Ig domain-containing protein [Acidobacteriota bacterium]